MMCLFLQNYKYFKQISQIYISVVVIFLSQLVFVFPLFLGMVMCCAHEYETNWKNKNNLN